MPYQLEIENNQLTHTGSFARPLLDLWGDGKAVLQGLYKAFSPHGAAFAAIRNESASASPPDQVVSVTLGPRSVHRFRLDRTETTVQDFSEEDLRKFPSLLEASSRWIREAVPSFSFSSHLFSYTAHGRLKSGVAGDMLKALGPAAPKAGGSDLGTGVIFHWRGPSPGWQTQLVLDHSVKLSGGLFVLFTLVIATDDIDYAKLAGEAQEYLYGVLSEIGVELVRIP